MASQQTSWVDGPFPLVSTKDWKSTDATEHASVFMALEMARIHNIIIRGLNALYLQGACVQSTEDVTDYLFFCKAWANLLDHHHEAEEKYLFPGFQELTGRTDLMASNIEQHEVFHKGLELFDAYVSNTKPEDYSWPTFKSLIDCFAPALLTHLDDEIPTLLAMRDHDDKELRKIWARTEKFATNTDGPGVAEMAVPFVLGCIDRTYEGGLHKNFPPLPFFVPPLVNYWLARKHRGAWRFLPCDFYRNPRPLAFTMATAV